MYLDDWVGFALNLFVVSFGLLSFQLSIVTSSPLQNSPIIFVLWIVENVRSIICQWMHAMGVIWFVFFGTLQLIARSLGHSLARISQLG